MIVSSLVLCMDIGGTHISAAVLDKEIVSVVGDARKTIKLDSSGSREQIVAKWEEAIDYVLARVPQPVGSMLISIPGPFDYSNGICLMDGMHKYQSLLHMDVKSYLANKYDVPAAHIHFFNDAHAFLLGEVYYHKLEGQNVVGLSMGTGLGSAYYDGTVVQDLNYGSSPFREGIAEDYISTRGVLQYLKSYSTVPFAHIKALVSDDSYSKERALAFTFLATSLIEFITLRVLPLKPDTIVLGGSISKSSDLFLEKVQAQIPVAIRLASFDDLNLFFGMLTII